MKKGLLLSVIAAGAMLMSGCASKKDLVECQQTNRNLTDQYQTAKEQLAASNARVTSLEQQLEQARKDYAKLQRSLDKSLTNANQNNMSIEKLVDQINESNQYIRHLVEEQERLAQYGAHQQSDTLAQQRGAQRGGHPGS